MAGNSSSKVPVFAALAILALIGVIVLLSKSGTTPPPPKTDAPKTDQATLDPKADPKLIPGVTPPVPNPNIKGGPKTVPDDRKILFTYLTRQGPTYFQAAKRFAETPYPFNNIPGAKEVAQTLAAQGRTVPTFVYASQQDTETVVESLGQETRTVASYTGYRHPTEGITLAYDVALTSGGVPQRMAGHLKPEGVQVAVFQGDQKVDDQEVKFPRGANIMPLDLNFIYFWYLSDLESGKRPMRWLFFVPEVMGFVALTARPMGKEVIAHRGQNRDCVKFEVLTASTQAMAGLVSRQEMWFDKSDGTLLRRHEIDDASGAASNFTERANAEDLKSLQPLVQRPPDLPNAPFPYPLDQDILYRIRSGDKSIGSVTVRYSKQLQKGEFTGYTSHSVLNLQTESTLRKESTETRFDPNFLPLRYMTQGEETADVKANYRVTADFAGSRVMIGLLRDVVTPDAVDPVSSKVKKNWEEDLTPPVRPGPLAPKPVAPDDDWLPPLKLVKFNGEEVNMEAPPPPKPRHQDEKLERPLTAGAMVMDYHRVEHFAVVAFRFPRPAWPKPGPDGSIAAPGSGFERRFQNTAFFSVRQNLTGIPQFAIQPEYRAPKLTTAELDPDLKGLETMPDDPPLYIAGTSHSMMPCTMILDEKGRLMQLNMKYGAHEIVFTMDDPITQRREEKMRVLKGQEGPTLIRPPWY